MQFLKFLEDNWFALVIGISSLVLGVGILKSPEHVGYKYGFVDFGDAHILVGGIFLLFGIFCLVAVVRKAQK